MAHESIELDFETECEECEEPLNHTLTQNGDSIYITIEPCTNCGAQSFIMGYNKALYDNGLDLAKNST